MVTRTKRVGVRRLGWITALALVGSAAVGQESPGAECDRLAAEPGTVPGVPGVELDAIVPQPAVAACERAVAEQPGELRFLYQYARALQRNGDAPAAARLYGWLAADGYAPAQHAFGIMLRNGAGVPADPATGEQWLRAAAEQGHDAARAALQAPPRPAADAASQTSPAADALRFDAFADMLTGLADEIPRTQFDLVAVLEQTGSEPEAIAEWVRRETVLVPYRGALRGPVGVLMDRRGNSLDRALLLASLVRAAGHEVRLATATLPAERAAALLDVPPPAATADDVAPDRDALVALLTASGRLDADSIGDAYDRMIAESDALERTLQEGTETISTALTAALGELPAAGRAPAERAAAIDALREHWWVQLRSGNGWRDLDPASDTVGSLTASATHEPTALPSDLEHTVQIDVILELWDRGTRREQTLLSHRLRPAEAGNAEVMLSHRPVSLPPPESFAGEPDPARAFLAAIEREWVWLPVLTVGAERVTDRLFTFRGDVLAADRQTLASFAATGLVSALTDVFAVLDGQERERDGPPDESTAPVRVTAEWLEITIVVPNEPPVKHRRAVFDLLGPAAREAGREPQIGEPERVRRAFELIDRIDVFVTGARVGAEATAHRIARGTPPLLRTIANGLRNDPTEPLSVPEERLPLPLLSYAIARHGAPTGDDRFVYASRPNVVLLRQGFAPPASADEPIEFVRVDIVANEIGTLPGAGNSFLLRLRQGITDTLAEHAVLGATARGDNAAASFRRDLAAGQRWLALAPGDLSRLGGLDLHADAKARIASDLASGFHVVLRPAAPVAWWRIDPVTGSTLGIAENGTGGAIGEYATTVANIVNLAACLYKGLGLIASRTISAGQVAGVAVCAAAAYIGASAGAVSIAARRAAGRATPTVAEYLAAHADATRLASAANSVSAVGAVVSAIGSWLP